MLTAAILLIGGTGTDTLINDTNNTIQGAGQVGINNGSTNAFNLDNKGTIDANVSSTLQIAPTNAVTNSGTTGQNAVLTISGGVASTFSGTITDGAHASSGLTLLGRM